MPSAWAMATTLDPGLFSANIRRQESRTMPQHITTGYRSLVDAAEREMETWSVSAGRGLHDRRDVMFVDRRDIRELNREGRIPGAFHCPRGMLEFWIDPQSPYPKP